MKLAFFVLLLVTPALVGASRQPLDQAKGATPGSSLSSTRKGT